MLISLNPATNELITEYPEHTDQQVDQILLQVQKEAEAWKHTGFAERARLMNAAAEALRRQKERLAELMAVEMGKPITGGRAEVEKCAWVCEYYAENAEAFLAEEVIETDASRSFVTFQPLGVVLAVMPWNFPLWQVFRFAAPTLMAGNGGVLKHASNVTGCALAIEEIFHLAGFPGNLFRTLKIGSKKVARVIENPAVKAVTLTGSVGAGRAVAKTAGASLKKTVLELGGSDPYVILEDADLDLAAAACVNSRLINSGQSCIAAKRFIVVASVQDAFQDKCVALMSNKKMGDPLEEGTDVGPQARTDLRDELHEQVTESIKKGATCLLGGEIPEGAGAWYPPTILKDVKPGMPAYHDELFGPVAAIIAAKDEAGAIAIANDSRFGLGAAVFTRDVARGERIAATELNAGCCFVNSLVKSDPRLPFGGIGESGYGRELSEFGIKEFVNAKTVYVK
ncbi:MAG: succinate-semialdehyde dehydrogenase/glutarate-semialdehyde dehydrogenase [Rhodothermales bacterium]|jgi:succinate-semialdehyde dehydrogenase/glutarate-semialdehyde dehydrogenase